MKAPRALYRSVLICVMLKLSQTDFKCSVNILKKHHPLLIAHLVGLYNAEFI